MPAGCLRGSNPLQRELSGAARVLEGRQNRSRNQDLQRRLEKIYPYAKAKPAMQFINASKKIFNPIHANNSLFYEELAHVIAKEPVDFIDPELRGLASSIGISKGKPLRS